MFSFDISIGAAFIAGLFMFLAPCTLPLVPAYLGFISGIDENDFKDPEKKKRARRKILLNGLFFVIGFSVIFVLFGILAGVIGSIALAPFRIWLGRIGGIFVIFFGLLMLDLIKFNIFKGANSLPIPKSLTLGKPLSSFMVGSAFAFGWSPCFGPIIASILALATVKATALQGAVMLSVFSLGLAIPFLLVALLFAHSTEYINTISKYLNIISKIGGVFLIGLGILLIFDQFNLLIVYGFEVLKFFNFDWVYNFL